MQAPRPQVQRWLGFAATLLAVPALLVGAGPHTWRDRADLAAERRRATAVAITRYVVAALDEFAQASGRYPSQADGLRALVPEQLGGMPLDPWGRALVYRTAPDGSWADAISYGRDGRPGGHGAAADLSGRYGVLHAGPAGLPWTGQLAVAAALLLGVAAAGRYPWLRGAMAGVSALCGLLVVVMLSGRLDSAPWAALAVAVAASCGLAAMALLRQAPWSRPATLVCWLATYVLLESFLT